MVDEIHINKMLPDSTPIIYQPYELGNTASRARVQPWCHPIPYTVSKNSNFEFDLFMKVYAERQEKGDLQSPWGVISTKFETKVGVSLKEFASFAKTSFKLGADCVFVNPMVELEPFYLSPWEHGANYHQDLGEVLNWLQVSKIMVPVNHASVDRFAMCNYFIANPSFWREYLRFVTGVLEAIESTAPPEILDLLSRAGDYEYNTNAPLRVFFIERLFTQFISISHLKVNLLDLRCQLNLRLGPQCGELVDGLSRLKKAAIDGADFKMLGEWDLMRERLYPFFKLEFDKRN